MSEVGWFFCGAWLFMFMTKTWFYIDNFQDDYYLVEGSCINSPDAWFCWHVRGMKRWDNKSYQEAVIIWTMARMISPREFKVNFNLATALHMSGHKEESYKFMQIAQDNIPPGQHEAQNLINDWRKGNMAILL